MAGVEIDNFVRKFKQLCFAGVSATLSVESSNGKAHLSLKAELDVKSPEVGPIGKFCSSAYSNSRRKSQRSKHGESFSSDEAVREVNNENRNVKFKVRDVKPDSLNTTDNVKLVKQTDVAHDEADGAVKTETVVNTKVDDDLAHVVKNNDNELDAGIDGIKIADDDMEEYKTDVVDSESSSELIYITASLKNSPHCRVDTTCQNSIFKILDSKEHLLRNIMKGKVEEIRATGANEGKYEHEVSMSIQVKTENLWEPARTYIWKHLGNSCSWKLQDGTEVSFVKIHRK